MSAPDNVPGFVGRFEWNGAKVRGIFGQGFATLWCSSEAEARLVASAAIRCREEWEAVNDPPCHPSDADWRPCVVCAGAGQ